MRLNFVVVYEHEGKYIAFTDSLINVETTNLKCQFERLCSASSFTGGKPYIIQYCKSSKQAREVCDLWNDSYKKNGTHLYNRG